MFWSPLHEFMRGEHWLQRDFAEITLGSGSKNLFNADAREWRKLRQGQKPALQTLCHFLIGKWVQLTSLKLCVRVSCRTRLHQKAEGLPDKTSLPKGINQILILNSKSLCIQECWVNLDMRVQMCNCRKPQVLSPDLCCQHNVTSLATTVIHAVAIHIEGGPKCRDVGDALPCMYVL